VNILCWGNIDAGASIIDRFPETRFIIDHMAILQPRTPPAPPNAWADLPKVLALAKRPNAVIKVSGACTLSHQPYPYPDIWDPLARIFDAWGLDRCLWRTDWTRASAVVNYEQATRPFLDTDHLSDSERAMLMRGACAKAYRWAPTGKAARRHPYLHSAGGSCDADERKNAMAFGKMMPLGVDNALFSSGPAEGQVLPFAS
jgi:L-fuconolactonase